MNVCFTTERMDKATYKDLQFQSAQLMIEKEIRDNVKRTYNKESFFSYELKLINFTIIEEKISFK